jgi:uncharacterized membrane protein
MPLHPKLVHLPIALAVLVPLVSTGLLFAWWRGALQRRTWVVAIALQALLVGSGVLALRSGEVDEERVEQVVPEPAIEAHEEAAETFVGASVAVLALVLVAGLIRREPVARGLAALGVLGSLAVLGLGYQVGDAGGRLVYQHGAAAAFANDAPIAPAAAHARGHGDNDD